MTARKINKSTDILVAMLTVCFCEVMHIGGFRVYYSPSPHHRYSVSFPNNFKIEDKDIKKRIVKKILNYVDKEIATKEIKPYTLNETEVIFTAYFPITFFVPNTLGVILITSGI